MSIYIQLYNNLQVRVMDYVNQGHLDSTEALDILVSYSIAEEGANNLYLFLIQTMVTKRDAEGYNVVEIEMILNYFPHAIWYTDGQLEPIRDKFYGPLISNVEMQIEMMDNRQFVSTFQGWALTGPKVFSQQLLNRYLNQYVRRIKYVKEEGQ